MGKKLFSIGIAILSLFVLSNANADANVAASAAENTTDTTAPVITLNGNSTITIQAGDNYTDLGVTTTDDSNGLGVSGVLGAITSTTISTVNTTTAGTYSVTYIAEDASGNRAKALRTVNVIDSTPPQITLNGDATVTIQAGKNYSDAGVSTTDNSGGAISVVTSINTTVDGNYVVTHTVSDSSGNRASVSRKVIVLKSNDEVAPVITLYGNNPVTVDTGVSYTDAGAIAIDDKDGIITVSIDDSKVNTALPGTYEVVLVATDSGGNSLRTVRTVVVEAAPDLGNLVGQWLLDDKGATTRDASGNNNHLTLNNLSDSNRVTGKYGSALQFLDDHRQDASIKGASSILQPESVTLSAWINPDQSELAWEWVAAQGDNYGLFIEPETKKLVFYKKEQGSWSGVKSAENTISFNKWQHVVGIFDAATATAKIYLDGVEVGSDVIGSQIVYDQGEGFTIGSMQGDRFFNGKIDDVRVYDSAFSEINVDYLLQRGSADSQLPVISLNGPKAVSVILGTSYNDAGATAVDNVDGQIGVAIDAAFSVDTSTLGRYTVSYLATDTAGNTAKTTRVVDVITADKTVPVITLNGPSPAIINTGSIYTDSGAIATDDVDINVAVDIDVSQVDTSTAGTYEVTFTAIDSAFNQKIVTRLVVVSSNPAVDQSVFMGTYNGSDKPAEGRRGSIEFTDYVDPVDPGETADWLTQSTGSIITVNSDASFTQALRAARPGDRIQLQSGDYKMQNIHISGTQGNPITIESVPGHTVAFDGSASGSAPRLDVQGAWLNFRNFEIKNGRQGSIYITQSHHNLFEGLKIHNNARGFDLTDGSHHTLIRFNESYHNFNRSNHGQDGDGFGIWSEGPYNDALGEGIILEYNIAWGNADDGIDMWMNETTVTLRNNIVRNNGFNVINDPAYVGNGNGFKLGPLGTGHIVIGNIADHNPADGFDHNGGSDDHYVKGNISTNNGAIDFDLPNTRVFEDNYKTGGVLAQ